MNELITTDNRESIQSNWYQSLVDDCNSIMVEAESRSKWVIVEGYHSLGMRILQDEPRMVQGGSTLRETLSHVTKLLNTKERTLYRAVQFAKKFPVLSELPGGRDTSWRKICNDYLPGHKEPNQPEFDENIETDNECPNCGYEW